MIECAGKTCPGSNWFHFACCGMTENSIPNGKWYCNNDNCKPEQEHPRKKSRTEPVKTNDKPQENSSQGKRQQKRPVLKRPETHYKLEDARNDAATFVTTILEAVSSHPCFINPFPTALLVIALTSALLCHKGENMFMDFCNYFLTEMWSVVTQGDNKPLTYAETLVTYFHNLRISEDLHNRWTNLLDMLGLSYGQLDSDILLQHLLTELLEMVVSKRNRVDLPIMEQVIQAEAMNKDEECVLAYVAGYVPFALRKHYRSLKNNSSASNFVDVLSSWACDGPFEKQYSFLEYTRDWISAQTRGRLFQPNAKVVILFRALESETRKHLNTHILGKYRDDNLRDILFEKLSTSYLIQQYWSKLTGEDLTPREKAILFRATINYWINIRCRAFAIVYIDIRKLTENLSKKGEKSLRKQLSNKNNL